MSELEYNAARRAKGLRAVAQGLKINLDLDVAIVCLNHAADKIEELERERDAERALADRLAEALRVAYGLITRHHEVGVTQELGCFCPVCHRDGKEPEMDQIIAALAAWKEARSE